MAVIANSCESYYGRYQKCHSSHTAVSYAKSLELNLPIAQKVSQLFENMLAAGDGELDHSGLIRELERMNHV